MAIDTADKRFSMLQFGGDCYSPGLIVPDATVSPGDRQSLLWGYSGILWGELIEIYEIINRRVNINREVSFSAETEQSLSVRANIQRKATAEVQLLRGQL